MTSSPRVHVVGMSPGASDLPREVREAVLGCSLLAGARRHHELFPDFSGERDFLEEGVSGLVARIARHRSLRAAILASGDPGLFGIAALVLRAVPREEVRIWPEVSSMQLAFARAGECWSGARIVSVHGRPLHSLAEVLGEPVVGLFTDRRNSPAAVGRFLVECGWGGLEMVVAEDLGLPSERLRRGPPRMFAEWSGSELNVVLLFRREPDLRPRGPGIPDAAFSHARGLITKAEVRAVAVGLLELDPSAVLWDVGAGSGSLSVEACRLFPGLLAHAVEREREQLEHLRENRRRFGAAGLIPHEGEAPGCLQELPAPRAVYVGGSGGSLEAVLDACWQPLQEGGVLVAAAVLVDTLTRTLAWAKGRGLSPELVEVRASRSEAIGGRLMLRPQNAVTLARFRKPGAAASVPQESR